MEVTKLSLDAAIAICKPGVPFKAVGAAIQEVADKHKFGVVRDFVGHGVGRVFHAAPFVPHFRNNENNGVMVSAWIACAASVLRLTDCFL